MKISTNGMYAVTKYIAKKNDVEVIEYGLLMGSDLKRMLRGYKYDVETDLYFSRKCKMAYHIVFSNYRVKIESNYFVDYDRIEYDDEYAERMYEIDLSKKRFW